jgi:replication factor C small subunit
MDESLRVSLIDQLGITDFRLSEGASSDLQMDALIAQFVMHAKHSGQR